jgi:hypothetical protein
MGKRGINMKKLLYSMAFVGLIGQAGSSLKANTFDDIKNLITNGLGQATAGARQTTCQKLSTASAFLGSTGALRSTTGSKVAELILNAVNNTKFPQVGIAFNDALKAVKTQYKNVMGQDLNIVDFSKLNSNVDADKYAAKAAIRSIICSFCSDANSQTPSGWTNNGAYLDDSKYQARTNMCNPRLTAE